MPFFGSHAGAAGQGGGCTDPVKVFDVTGGTLNDQALLSASSLRQVAPNISAGGNEARARFVASTTGTFRIDNASIGIRSGTTVNTIATPIELLFGATSGIVLTAGQSAWSDWTAFTCSASDDLMVIWDAATAADANVRRSSITLAGSARYFGPPPSYADAVPTGFGAPNTNLYDGMFEVEVRTCT